MAAPMKPSEALRKARALITPEGAWMQGRLVSKEGSFDTRWDDPDADCFCSYGAILAATKSEDAIEGHYLRRIVGGPISRWNDAPSRTHAEVLDAFDRAAVLAEAEGR